MISTCLSIVFTQDKASINKGGVSSNLGANASAKVVFEVVQDHAGPLLRAIFYLLKHVHAGSESQKTLPVKKFVFNRGRDKHPHQITTLCNILSDQGQHKLHMLTGTEAATVAAFVCRPMM